MNESSLREKVAADGASFLSYDERFVKGHKRKFASFECSCGCEAESNAYSILHKGGAFCKSCVKRRTSVKRQQTLAASNDVSSTLTLFLMTKDNTISIMPETVLHLRLAASSLRPSITRPFLSTGYQFALSRKVTWWDLRSIREKSHLFPSPEEDQQAEEWHQQKMEEVAGKQVVVQQSVQDILPRLRWWQKHFRLHDQMVHYDTKAVPLESYALGAWIGDGDSRNPVITNIDQEIIQYCREYAARLGIRLTERKTTNDVFYLSFRACSQRDINPVRVALKELGLLCNKHLPRCYLENSRENRLQLLAGLIDTDGHLTGRGTAYEFVQKSEAVFDGVRELCQGLGFRMTKKEKVATCVYKGEKVYCDVFRGRITGEQLCDVPVLIPRKKVTRKAQLLCLPRFEITNTPPAAAEA